MNSNFWIILIVVSMSFLSWLFGKIREQREIARIRQVRARQREESLRTGRGIQADSSRQPTGAQTPRPGASQQERMQARQAQLKALREQQLERMRRQAQVRKTTPKQPQKTPGPAQAGPRPAPSIRPASAPQPRARRTRQTAPAQRRQPAPSRAAEQVRAVEMRLREEEKKAERARKRRLELAKKSAPPITAQGSAGVALSTAAPLTTEDWRRAIIMSEILAGPVSLREGES